MVTSSFVILILQVLWHCNRLWATVVCRIVYMDTSL